MLWGRALGTLGIVLVLLGISSPHDAGTATEMPSTKGLEFKLETMGDSFSIEKPIPVRLIFRNASPKTLLVNTIFGSSGLDGTCRLDFQAIRFPRHEPKRNERHIRIDKLSRDSFREIPPGGQLEIPLDVRDMLVMADEGAYTVQATYASSYVGEVPRVWTGTIRAKMSFRLIR